MGGATDALLGPLEILLISIHAPRGGSDCRRCIVPLKFFVFQSTLPVGGATIPRLSKNRLLFYFNPRSPWGERLQHTGVCLTRFGYFNPRSPWGERLKTNSRISKLYRFQSTLPVGGATRAGLFGVRNTEVFQSTLPVGGATTEGIHAVVFSEISIHAPRGGSDSKDAQISGSIFGKGVNFVGHNPGKIVPNRFKNRWHLHRFPKKAVRTSRDSLYTYASHYKIRVSSGR